MKQEALGDLQTEYRTVKKALNCIIKKQADHYFSAQTAKDTLEKTTMNAHVSKALDTLKTKPLVALPLTETENQQLRATQDLIKNLTQKYQHSTKKHHQETVGHCINTISRQLQSLQKILSVGYAEYLAWAKTELSGTVHKHREALGISAPVHPVVYSSAPLSHEPAQTSTGPAPGNMQNCSLYGNS